MDRINESKDLFDKYKSLKSKEYYFAMATMVKNKNFQWIIDCARYNPDKIFVIAGMGNARFNISDITNIQFLGYVSDEDAKSLMANCKGFLFPLFMRGLGCCR